MQRSLREDIALVLLHVYAVRATKGLDNTADVDWQTCGELTWKAAGEVETGFLESDSFPPAIDPHRHPKI